MMNNMDKIYEQYWFHARHQENQRLWFTNVYAVIVAGSFAYINAIENDFKVPLLIFLIILSFFGYLMTHTWNIPYVIFSRLAEEIAICEWNLPKKYQRFSEYGKGYKYSKYIGFGEKISVRTSGARIFICFYSLMIGLFGGLLFQKKYNLTSYHQVLITVFLFALFYLYYHFYLESRSIGKIQSDFMDRIREYCEKG